MISDLPRFNPVISKLSANAETLLEIVVVMPAYGATILPATFSSFTVTFPSWEPNPSGKIKILELDSVGDTVPTPMLTFILVWLTSSVTTNEPLYAVFAAPVIVTLLSALNPWANVVFTVAIPYVKS